MKLFANVRESLSILDLEERNDDHMPNQKVVLTYVEYQSSWEEVFYASNASIQATQAAINNSFINAALAFRQKSTYIAAVRVSDMAQPRSVLLRKVTPPAAPASPDAPDVVGVCANVRLRDAAFQGSRLLQLRGLPDSSIAFVPSTGAPQPSPALTNGIASYLQAINGAGLQIHSLLPITGANPYAWYDVIAITLPSFGGIQLTTAIGSVPLGPSGRVILSQFDRKMWPGLNGHYNTLKVAGGQFNVRYHSDLSAGTYPINKGRYRVEEYRYLLVDFYGPAGNSSFDSEGHRNTKNGPFGGRGAKRPVRLRYQ